MSRRAQAARGEGERLRGEILDAAEALLVERGDAEAVSVRAVAGRVGCTPGAIYLHFADKTELLFEVSMRQFEALQARCNEAAAGVTDPVEALRLRGRAYARFGIDHPEQYRILFMERASLIPDGMPPEELLATSAFHDLVEAVGVAMEAGALRPGDPFATAVVMWVAVHGITSLVISKPWFPWGDVDAAVDAVVDTQMRGLAP